MKVAIVANNYGQNYDGVGAFATVISKNFSNNIEVSVFTGFSNENDSKLKRLSALGMTKAFLNVAKDIEQFDVILIDYPFVEWNPLIVIAFDYLKIIAKLKRVKVVLSLHEYRRVNILRKYVIRVFAKRADLVLVANAQLKEDVSKYAKKIELRGIPTNLFSNNLIINEKEDAYVYFGLINKSKAFTEMINSWDRYNINNTYKLYILTGTKDAIDARKHCNVEYIYKANDEEVLSIMSKCKFCIVPVKPEVDMKNATFKTGALCGCVCIGKFCEDYSNNSFVINMKDYSEEEFLAAYEVAQNKWTGELVEVASRFGSGYTPEAIAKVVETTIRNI